MSTSDEQPGVNDSDNPDPRQATPEENFSQNVKFLREKLGLSQEAVAEKMQERGHSFHQATVYKIESGTRRVTVSEANALAQILKNDLRRMLETPPHLVDIWYLRNLMSEFESATSDLYKALDGYRSARQEILVEIEDRPERFKRASGTRSLRDYEQRALRSATAIIEEAEQPRYILGKEGAEPVGELTVDQQIELARWELDRATFVHSSTTERLDIAKTNLKRLQAIRDLHEQRDLILQAMKQAGIVEAELDALGSALDRVYNDQDDIRLLLTVDNLAQRLRNIPVDWDATGLDVAQLIDDLGFPPRGEGAR